MWTKIVTLIFGSTVATTPPTPVYAPPVLDELLTYECAKSVADVVGNGPQIGPVFSREDLVFTSISGARGEKLLMVDAGSGIFAINLNAVGVNRIRFTIPVGGEKRNFFLGYIHGDRYRSRMTEFSSGRAPMGRDDIDYQSVSIRRAENLLPHLEYAIFQTTQATLSAIAEKRVTRQDLNVIETRSCDHISRRSPALARNLRFDFALITREILGPNRLASGARMPASTGKLKILLTPATVESKLFRSN